MVRLVVLGDVHYRTAGPLDSSILVDHSSLILETALRQVAAEPNPPDLLIQIGDMIDGTRQTREEARRDLDRAIALFDQSGLRWTWILGNHDLETLRDRNGFLPYLRRPRSYGEVELENNVILLLDSALAECFGSIDAEQQAWLEAALERHRDRRIFVFLHHTFDMSIEHDMYLDNADVIRPLLSNSPAVKAIFMGHAHTNRIDVRNDALPEITTSALTSWPLMFRRIEIDTDWIRIRSEKVQVEPSLVAEALAAHRLYPKPWRDYPRDVDLNADLAIR
jgi:3',5'-cyclic AMP phosphodiesterase CpdA